MTSELGIMDGADGRYDDNGGTRLPASAFVPREAALAARNAAIAREKALAAAIPLPATNDADIEVPPVVPAPTRRMPVLPKLPPLPKFGLGKRPASQPGRPRAAVEELKPAVPAAREEPTSILATPGRTASPGRMDVPAPEADITDGIKRNESEPKTVAFGGVESMPAPAIPARLLSTNAVPSGIATPPMLNEALLIERGRRRLGLPGVSTPAIARTASTPAVAISAIQKGSAPSSRQPTPASGIPPNGGDSSVVGTPGVGPQSIGSGGILAPVPRRTPMFKSIPAPVSTAATPRPEDSKELS